MLKSQQKLRDQKGFTIIEVLIVLAIAGLIMVIVFLAVPNLQRTQRNNARKTDANNLLSNLAEYVSNNAGKVPVTACSGTGCAWAATVVNNKLGQYDQAQISFRVASGGAVPTQDQAVLVGNAKCGATPDLAPIAGTARDYVVWYGIEGSTGHVCTSGN